MKDNVNNDIIYYRECLIDSIEDIKFGNLVIIKTTEGTVIITNKKNLTSKPFREKYITMSLFKGI